MEDMDEMNENNKLMNDNNNNNDSQIETNSKKNKIKIIIFLLLLILIIAFTIIVIIILLKDDNNNNDSPSKKDDDPSHVYIEPSSGIHTHTIIFMPGLTNTPEDFIPALTEKLPYNKKNTTKLVILRSQLHEVTVLNGTQNYSWFDIYYFPMNSSDSFNFEDLKKSSNLLKDIIEEEVEKLDQNYDKIIVGGHSQGAMLSLYTGYTFKNKLGGVVALSGALPPIKKEDISPDKKNLNVFYVYGDSDDIISPKYLNESINEIKDFEGLNVTIYPNHAHYVNRQEWEDAGAFLDNIM